GEYIARFLHRFGYGTIRGSSTRGGARGLVEMIRGMDRGLSMGFTIDGPRGPRHVAKSGAILLAKKTGNPILPFIVQPRRFWTLNSWDRLQIPRPFTRGLMIFGMAITVSRNASDEELEVKRQELQASLDDLVNRVNEWSEKP
ncbi:MAG: lysophospholipid acyltransferase family protein, partial [Pyrinomonadaceae bacterium]